MCPSKRKKKRDYGDYSADEIEAVRDKPPKKSKKRYPDENFYQDKLSELPKDKYFQDGLDEDDDDVKHKEGWTDGWDDGWDENDPMFKDKKRKKKKDKDEDWDFLD